MGKLIIFYIYNFAFYNQHQIFDLLFFLTLTIFFGFLYPPAL
jgi:hypothetical protein